MYDTHVHSTFSPDGRSAVSEYINLIDRGELKAIGFAEHLDFLPECGAYRFLDHSSYRAVIDGYRKKGYPVYAGAEVDYAFRVESEILERLKSESYDFTICSIHMINGVAVSDRNIDHFFKREIFYNMVENYYDELHCALKAGKFDVIGHIGVFRRYLEEDFYDEELRNRLDELDNEVARICAKSGIIIEVNSSGLFAVCKSTVPRISFLKQYYEYGGRRVCMSSDAHDVRHAGRGFDIVKENLNAIGFDYIYLPWDKENPVKLV